MVSTSPVGHRAQIECLINVQFMSCVLRYDNKAFYITYLKKRSNKTWQIQLNLFFHCHLKGIYMHFNPSISFSMGRNRCTPALDIIFTLKSTWI